ncbi:MAG: caspase domain-containing protein [Burkholderiales bacterium]
MLAVRLLGGIPRMLEGEALPQARPYAWASIWALLGLVACAVSMGALLWRTQSSLLGVALGSALMLLLLGALHAYGFLALLTPNPSGTPLAGAPLKRRLSGLAAAMALLMLPLTQPFVLLLADPPEAANAVTAEAIRARAALGIAKDEEARARLSLARTAQAASQISLPVSVAAIDTGSQSTGATLPPQAGAQQIASNPAQSPGAVAAPAPAELPGPAAPPAANTPLAALPGSLQGLARRKALVIGNGRYSHQKPLPGALQDASDISQALRALSFEVTVVQDGTRTDMEAAIEAYIAALKPGDISFFHFSGHGLQLRGDNYLAPVEMRDLGDGFAPPATSVNTLIEGIARRQPLASIIAIDACRSGVSGLPVKGLAPIELGRNTYIAMAAAPGQEALESNDPRSVPRGFFSASLARRILDPMDIDLVFRAVRNDVFRISQGKQTPWSSVGLEGQLILASAQRVTPGRPETTRTLTLAAASPSSAALPAASRSAPTQDPATPGRKPFLCDGEPIGQPGRQEEEARCMSARLQMQADDLKIAGERVAELSEAANKASEVPHSELRRLRVLWLSVWSEPLSAAALTLVIWFLMAGGFWMRARLMTFHEAYASRLHEATSALLRDYADQALVVAQAMPWSGSREALRTRMMARFGPDAALPQERADRDHWHAFLGLATSSQEGV